jgi:hypothetical protein
MLENRADGFIMIISAQNRIGDFIGSRGTYILYKKGSRVIGPFFNPQTVDRLRERSGLYTDFRVINIKSQRDDIKEVS